MSRGTNGYRTDMHKEATVMAVLNRTDKFVIESVVVDRFQQHSPVCP